ncbi:hypothetical protein TEA_021308 [Camellia sinensis var. sinensis]|uniref:PB1 domain-containing protein n=1 Tax=Camellia sinensis var. sinensis TaxID=542762 RepID=A0A4V3WMC8_CAMSN|nr:hypothetical protein TEA_021308 [Camellia sinensis var. sinensis]
MAKGKLILICQSGGEFLKDDDGSLKYAGGEAQAVNVNCETLFDALKLKLAEMCNLEYKTVSIKYFLPGNTRTLITLSNDKDLKRMLDFHGDSVIADVFVMGTEGFNGDTLNIFTNRETGIKVAESVNCVVAPKAAVTTSPVDASGPVGTSAACVATRRTKARKKATPAFTDSVTGVDATERRRPTKATTTSNTPHDDSDNSSAPLYSPANVAAKSNDHNLIEEAGHNKDSCEAKEANVLEPTTMVDSCTNSREAGHNKDSCEAKEANVLELTTMVDSCTNSKEAGHNKDSCEAKEANVLEPMTMVDSCTNSKEAGRNKDSCEAKEANVLEPTTMVDSCTNSKEAGHNKDSCEAKEANVLEPTTRVDFCTNCEEAGDNKADCEATL